MMRNSVADDDNKFKKKNLLTLAEKKKKKQNRILDADLLYFFFFCKLSRAFYISTKKCSYLSKYYKKKVAFLQSHDYLY